MPAGLEYAEADLEALARPLTLLDTEARRIVAGNRIVYQPMEGNDAEADGSPSPLTLTRYLERANGRAGLDVFEAIAAGVNGKARPNQLMLTPDTKRGFAWLVKRYRGANATTPILFQITHSGRFAEAPVSPYPVEGARLLTDGDMAGIQQDLVNATKLAYEVGADGIDLKHCHGYLCGALLGPANRARDDWSYGGETIEERSRFMTETLAMMRAEVPPDRFLTMVRISAFEGLPGGFGSKDATSDEEDESLTELRALARILETAGVHVINQSSGVPEITTTLVRQTNANPMDFFHHQERAAAIKETVNVPVIGSAYSYARSGLNKLPGERAEKNIVALGGRAIREDRVDMIGIGRQCLAEPYFARKLLGGDADAIRWDTSCSRCGISLRSGIPAGCVTHDAYYRDLWKRVRAD
jgi:2,4-dienoyl-CoA reductase-like NADH-dependent reductase (Old Yellow Enzyme family)